MISRRSIDIYRSANGQDYRLYTLTIRRGSRTTEDIIVEISDEVFHKTTLTEMEESLQKYYNHKNVKVLSIIPITEIWHMQ